jgi:hypothetical protein
VSQAGTDVRVIVTNERYMAEFDYRLQKRGHLHKDHCTDVQRVPDAIPAAYF